MKVQESNLLLSSLSSFFIKSKYLHKVRTRELFDFIIEDISKVTGEAEFTFNSRLALPVTEIHALVSSLLTRTAFIVLGSSNEFKLYSVVSSPKVNFFIFLFFIRYYHFFHLFFSVHCSPTRRRCLLEKKILSAE